MSGRIRDPYEMVIKKLQARGSLPGLIVGGHVRMVVGEFYYLMLVINPKLQEGLNTVRVSAATSSWTAGIVYLLRRIGYIGAV